MTGIVAPVGMVGIVVSGQLFLVEADTVHTVNYGEAFAFGADDLVDIFCAEPTVIHELSGSPGLARFGVAS